MKVRIVKEVKKEWWLVVTFRLWQCFVLFKKGCVPWLNYAGNMIQEELPTSQIFCEIKLFIEDFTTIIIQTTSLKFNLVKNGVKNMLPFVVGYIWSSQEFKTALTTQFLFLSYNHSWSHSWGQGSMWTTYPQKANWLKIFSPKMLKAPVLSNPP